MPDPTRVLLWTDGPAPYINAIAAAGLAPRVTVESLARKDQPSDAQMSQTEALLAWGAPPGLLPRMPKLRWAQALTAGVEGWLALPDLPPGLTLTCARGTHRESMPENILGALFYLTKPYAACVTDQKQSKWTRRVATPLTGQTLGILGLGAVGQDVARLAAALGMRVIGTKRNPAPIEGVAQVLPPERIDTVLAQADYVLLLLPATAADREFDQCRAPVSDETDRLAAEFRPRRTDRRCRSDRRGRRETDRRRDPGRVPSGAAARNASVLDVGRA